MLDDTILDALASQAEHHGSAARMKLLGQQLTTEERESLRIHGSIRNVWAQGETVLREGDNTRALYHLVRGQIRAELMLPGDEPGGKLKAVVVGRLEAGDVFGERSLLIGGGSSATLVISSESAETVKLPETVFRKLFASHPELVSKLFAHIAAYQARRLKGLDEEEIPTVVVEAESAQPADLSTIVSNPAYLSILYRYVQSLCEAPAGAALVAQPQGSEDNRLDQTVALAIRAQLDF